APQLVRQAQVHVISKSALSSSVLLVRIERLDDVLAPVRSVVGATQPVLRRDRQALHVENEGLSQILRIGSGTTSTHACGPIFSHLWKYKSVVWAGGFLD